MLTKEDVKLIKDFSGLTHEELGAELGYHPMSIVHIERGYHPMTTPFEQRLLNWLKSDKASERLKRLLELRGDLQ